MQVSSSDSDQNIAFLLTGSNARGATESLGNIPDYEDFTDRYSNAATPFIISQKFGGNLYDQLNSDFKLTILSPSFILNHLIFAQENDLNISSLSVNKMIKYIIDTKVYKKNTFIKNNFQNYIPRCIH
mgnify:CR=1 FL=1